MCSVYGSILCCSILGILGVVAVISDSFYSSTSKASSIFASSVYNASGIRRRRLFLCRYRY